MYTTAAAKAIGPKRRLYQLCDSYDVCIAPGGFDELL